MKSFALVAVLLVALAISAQGKDQHGFDFQQRVLTFSLGSSAFGILLRIFP
jgi:opacity protein-like surface antigen